MQIEDAISRLQAAQGDQQNLLLVTVDIVLTGRDPSLRAALEAAAVPHWFNSGILARLLGVEAAPAAGIVETLRNLPMVENFTAREGYNVHEATRLALRRELASADRARLIELSSRAVGCFDGDAPHLKIERVYHRLLAEPEPAAEELGCLWSKWNELGRYELLQSLGVALGELVSLPTLAPPARARTVLCLGLIRRNRAPVADIERWAREALGLFQNLGNAAGEIDARFLLGGALRSEGWPADALREYEACKQIALGLTQRHPDDAAWLRKLAVSHDHLGGIYQVQSRLDDALREFDADMQITLGLTRRDPDNTSWLRDLGVSHNKVGGVYQVQARLDDALREYQAYNQIMLGLAQRDPDNTGWMRELSVSHNHVGDIYREQGRIDDALREYDADKQIAMDLARRDPDNADWLRDLGVSHNKVGGVYQVQARLDDALREYQAYNQIMLGLAQRDPDNTSWLLDLSESHNNVGEICRAQGRIDDALHEFEASKRIRLGLTRRDPDNTSWLRGLAGSHNYVGKVYEAQARLDEAMREYQSALAIAEGLCRHDPSNKKWQDDLRVTSDNIEHLHKHPDFAKQPGE